MRDRREALTAPPGISCKESKVQEWLYFFSRQTCSSWKEKTFYVVHLEVYQITPYVDDTKGLTMLSSHAAEESQCSQEEQWFCHHQHTFDAPRRMWEWWERLSESSEWKSWLIKRPERKFDDENKFGFFWFFLHFHFLLFACVSRWLPTQQEKQQQVLIVQLCWQRKSMT